MTDALTDALNQAIRATFIGSAGGRLRLRAPGERREPRRRLHFTGFHRDGTPFVVLSAPFTEARSNAPRRWRRISSPHTQECNSCPHPRQSPAWRRRCAAA